MKVTRAVLAALIASFSASGAHAQTDALAVALKGYDVVAYFTESRASKGSPGFRHDWDGARYYFTSATHKAAFVGDPDRYAPQFRSYCAAGISAGKKVEADPTAWKIVDGRLYVFSAHRAAEDVDKDPGILARSQQAWEAMR
jgi:YHS domain-containing protein